MAKQSQSRSNKRRTVLVTLFSWNSFLFLHPMRGGQAKGSASQEDVQQLCPNLPRPSILSGVVK